jgi:hypothetical protein
LSRSFFGLDFVCEDPENGVAVANGWGERDEMAGGKGREAEERVRGRVRAVGESSALGSRSCSKPGEM